MYLSEVKLNNKKFKGTLTFNTLVKIKDSLLEEFKKDITITEIFDGLTKFDMTIFTVFMIESIYATGEYEKEEIIEAFINDEDIINKFNDAYSYIYKLISKCLPKEIEEFNESEFEDEYDQEGNNTEWELDYMEYLWSTVLKRNDFWNVTPKNFFEQMDIHKKVNSSGKEKSNVEEI
ncbi:hypothetical protein [Clostridium perfringens]|uniref:hypothetical protein n=1 Tax=Clostridium perfringens TaxID=1502 RepID=UPI0022469D7A|nr:hypothetical protein [Clostridium perfringens]MCX0403281.1 hypothetical protein [Clostridium perfringens]